MGCMAWRRTLSLEAELEMADDLIDGLRVFDEGDDTHLASAGRTNKMVYLVNFADHLGPASGTNMSTEVRSSIK